MNSNNLVQSNFSETIIFRVERGAYRWLNHRANKPKILQNERVSISSTLDLVHQNALSSVTACLPTSSKLTSVT